LLHFYIHAAQMAGQSQLAVDAAKQLLAFQFPAADSHLTHMPGHTFFDVGMYDEALDAGERSIAMDAADVACCHPGFYSATRFYHHHNVSFVLYAMTQTGQTARAVDVARAENDDALIARQLVAARRWNDVVAMPYDKKTSSAPETFARGVAYAELGNTAQAQQMLANLPADPTDAPSSAATLQAMKLTLRAQIAEANHDDAEALELLTQASAAAAAGNKLGAVEIPSLYYFSPHMALAELAMRDGKLDVARQALQAELEASPRSKVALSALAQLKQ
jgi:tetratricopeptide (TPR) repeat protein